MTASAIRWRAGAVLRPAIWFFHLALPIAGLWLLLAHPTLDVMWEDHGAHFWLILAVAGVNVVLAAVITTITHRRGDARLFLVSLALGVAAGFFALHALATPQVLLATPNAAFTLSTPVGVLLAGVFGLLSSIDLPPAVATTILRRRTLLVGAVVLLLVGWGIASLVPGSPLGMPLPPARAQPILRAVAIVGIACTLSTAIGYLALFRRRPTVVAASVVTAFVLLTEALLAIALSQSWHASWWEWHVLLLLAFGYVAYSAYAESRREETGTSLFRALSLEETAQRLRDEYGQALERLVTEIDTASETGDVVEVEREAAALAARYDLTPGQADVLARAARALAAERREVRRLGLFRRYLSPEVASALLEDPSQAALGGATVEVSVLFADLQGFTSFAERSSPDAVVRLLNTYFGAVVPVVLGEGGTVVQFIGDAIVAVFNAPVAQPDHPRRAARAAMGLQAAVAGIAAEHPDWPRFRAGIATGPAVVGNVGSDEVRSFTAIGDTVNLAARLQGTAAPGQVVVSAATAARLGGADLAGADLRPIGDLTLKGKASAEPAFELIGLREPPGPAPSRDPSSGDPSSGDTSPA